MIGGAPARAFAAIVIGVALFAAAGCAPRPGPAAAVPSCRATVVETGPSRVRVHVDSNVRAGTPISLEMWGNGALVAAYASSTGYNGTVDTDVGVPVYPYEVEWVGKAIHSGRVLCSVVYHAPATL